MPTNIPPSWTADVTTTLDEISTPLEPEVNTVLIFPAAGATEYTRTPAAQRVSIAVSSIRGGGDEESHLSGYVHVAADLLRPELIDHLSEHFTEPLDHLTGVDHLTGDFWKGPGWSDAVNAVLSTLVSDIQLGTDEDVDVLVETSSDFPDALQDLAEVSLEAKEEQFPIPSTEARVNADRILRAMYGVFPRRFEVYPMPDGEIAIDTASGPGYSVVLLCASDGSATCLVNINGAGRSESYPDASVLPDDFLREALQELQNHHHLTA